MLDKNVKWRRPEYVLRQCLPVVTKVEELLVKHLVMYCVVSGYGCADLVEAYKSCAKVVEVTTDT